jgi:hypothetical protein
MLSEEQPALIVKPARKAKHNNSEQNRLKFTDISYPLFPRFILKIPHINIITTRPE